MKAGAGGSRSCRAPPPPGTSTRRRATPSPRSCAACSRPSERTGRVSVLVTAAELLAGTRRRVVLLDVRWALGDPHGREHYLDGHLPGAVFVDLETELADPPSAAEGRHPMPRYSDCNRRPADGGSGPATAWSPTTPAVARPRRARGGCSAGAGFPTSGCWTGGWTPGAGRGPAGQRARRPRARGRDAARRRRCRPCPWTTPPRGRPQACCWTRGRGSATAARSSRSTHGRATCPARSARRRRRTSPSTGASGRPPNCASGSLRWVRTGRTRGRLLRLRGHRGTRGGSAGRGRHRRSALARVLVAVVERPVSPRRDRARVTGRSHQIGGPCGCPVARALHRRECAVPARELLGGRPRLVVDHRSRRPSAAAGRRHGIPDPFPREGRAEDRTRTRCTST